MSETLRKLIKLYQGSPNKWDGPFDPQYIGSGEGAAMYGVGHYLAQEPAVANGYRERLTDTHREPFKSLSVAGKRITPEQMNYEPNPRLEHGTPEYYKDSIRTQLIEDALINEGTLRGLGEEKFSEWLNNKVDEMIQYSIEDGDSDKYINALREIKEEINTPGTTGVDYGDRPGQTVEVDLEADDAELLDYDSSEQSPQVIAALNRLGIDGRGKTGKEIQRELYRSIKSSLEDPTNTGQADIAKAVSETLAGEGIPGMRYLDEGSRGLAGTPEELLTRNYLMFPGSESRMNIVRRYAVPGAIAAGAAAGGTQAQAAMTDEEAALQSQAQDFLAGNNGGRFDRTAPSGDLLSTDAVAGKAPADLTKAEKNRLSKAIGNYTDGMTLPEALASSELSENKRQYVQAVADSLDQPVISTEAAAEFLSDDGVAERYPSGFLTPKQYFAERVAVQQARIADRVWEERYGGRDVNPGAKDAFLARVREQSERKAEANWPIVGGVLAGTLKTDTQERNAANEIKQVVQMHTPGQMYAAFAPRTQSEQDKLDSLGDGRFQVTEDGMQNMKAQRLTDLWSATDDSYSAAGIFPQAARFVGGVASPAYNRLSAIFSRGLVDGMLANDVNRNMPSQFTDMAKMMEPDGKLAYAAQMYARGAGENTSMYTDDGEAKTLASDPTSMRGIAEMAYKNQDYPLAYGYQAMSPIRNLADSIANTGEGDARQQKLAELRGRFNRTTPVVPDGMDPEVFKRLGTSLNEAEGKLGGYTSATAGPVFADVYNATGLNKLTGDAKREYASPMFTALLETPGEMVTDPLNLGVNLLGGPVFSGVIGGMSGGAKGGLSAAGKQFLKSTGSALAKAPTTIWDDIVDEQVENNAFFGPMGGVQEFISPEATNAMMGDTRADDPEYWKKYFAAGTNTRADLMDIASEYDEEKKKAAKKNAIGGA